MLPAWNGADVVYSRAYQVLDEMRAGGHVTLTKLGKRVTCHVSEDMRRLIDALDSGDEETIKGLLLDRRTTAFVQEARTYAHP